MTGNVTHMMRKKNQRSHPQSMAVREAVSTEDRRGDDKKWFTEKNEFYEGCQSLRVRKKANSLHHTKEQKGANRDRKGGSGSLKRSSKKGFWVH